MKTLRKHNLPFWPIAAATIVVAGLIIVGLSGPVGKWRNQLVASLIDSSRSAKTAQQKEQLLAEANIVGWGSEQAPKALADYYISIGRYDKAWPILASWPVAPNYLQLGEYALLSQDYNAAQRFYARAITKKATAEAHVGIAAAQFNRGDTKNGCANAAKASKLDLNSEAARQSAVACLLLNPTFKQLDAASYPELNSNQLASNRGRGMFLIANRLYAPGEKLLAPAAATPGDWLALAQLANLRGNYKLAIERGESGIKLDRSNPELNKLLMLSYRALGQDKADYYARRLELLPLDK